MSKIFSLLISLALILSLTGTALAQEPVYPADSDPTWQANYWNNTSLSGTPVLQRQESKLDHDWGNGSPATSVNADGFSARWTRYIYVDKGTYRFTATSDDGIRVWVDNDLIINEWYDHPAKTTSAEKYLTHGHHWVVVEFYENGGLATAKMTWSSTHGPAQEWQGEYFDNVSLSGTPALVRDDDQINFNWGDGSPAPGIIDTDEFSVRWSRTLDMPAGNYRFAMTVDDGGRLWVNGHLLIDTWQDQSARTYTGEIFVPGGDVPLKMEYYENGGNAVARLSWEKLTSSVYDWRGEYFNNTSLSGSPALVRDDNRIDFNWGNGSPAPGTIGSDRFSVRWSQTLNFEAGTYRFAMTVDDGGRLWVNGHLLIDAWRDQAARTYTGEIYLSGDAPVKMEFYEQTGHAVARLSWSQVGAEPPASGTVVVDNGDAGFVRGGTPDSWRTVYEGYGGQLVWTWNNDWERPNYNWVTWYPNLTSGRYEVYVYIPERYTTTANARYWVSHANGNALRQVDQSTQGDRWVSLGTYWFDGTDDEYVFLSDATYETRLTRMVAFDAVKWVPR